MTFLESIIHRKLDEARDIIYARLSENTAQRHEEAKRYVEADMFEDVQLDEASANVVKMGRIQKIRRRIRRNAKGRIIVQRNVKRSSIKGYRISGNTVKRISATSRIHKARMLKRSWKTTRKSKLRRSLLKRKMSMRRRSSMGIK